MKKYEFTSETINFCGRELHRIKALIDFGDVKAGDLGGYIEKEENLSHEGNAWVYDAAKVYDEARVYNEAEVYGKAMVYSEAEVYGEAKVYDAAKVYDEAMIYGEAMVYGEAEVCGKAMVYGKAEVYDAARVYDAAEVYSTAKVYGKAMVYGAAKVYDAARVYGEAEIRDTARVCINADIKSFRDVFYSFGLGEEEHGTTFFRTKSGEIAVKSGCFFGSMLKEFEDRVKSSRKGIIEREYLLHLKTAKAHFGLEEVKESYDKSRTITESQI